MSKKWSSPGKNKIIKLHFMNDTKHVTPQIFIKITLNEEVMDEITDFLVRGLFTKK